jgi:ribosomal protein L7/L12
MVDEREMILLRERVTELEAQVQFLLKSLNLTYKTDTTAKDANTARVVEFIRRGDKIGAIKAHRELFLTSLEEAKNAVEELQRMYR